MGDGRREEWRAGRAMSVARVFSHSRDAKDGFGNIALKGSVERVLDHRIGKTAFSISGGASQANYLRCPKSTASSLRMRGELLYVEMLVGAGQKYALHFDVETASGDIVRLSLGNIYTDAKTYRNAAGTVVLVPLPASIESRWSVVAIDMTAVLSSFEQTSHLQYTCLRAVQCCASMVLRNVFVSMEVFTPESLPRDLRLPVPTGQTWDELYGWHWVAASPRPAKMVGRREPRATPARPPGALPAPAPEASASLSLTRAAGYSGDRSRVLLWSRDGDSLIYACNATIIVHDLKQDTQRFILGHTNAINMMLLSHDGSILATAQDGRFPHVRLWDWVSGKCIAMLRPSASPPAKADGTVQPPDKPVVAMAFDPEDGNFMAVTRGRRSNFVACSWKLSKTPAGPLPIACDLTARHTLECDVRCLEHSPFGPQQFVTCGAENIRFWRIKDGHLHSRPVALGPHAETTFTAIAFESVYADDPQGRRVFVGTDQGSIFQVHGPSAALQVIYKVHSGPINTMQVNESFCVTGSDDAYVRVWPLDFVDYFLEAHHDSAITSLDVSSDGLHIAIGTEQGAVGLLSVGDQVHRNVLRSHSDTVTGLAIDVHDSMAATAAADGTIRVWSLREPFCQQLYEIEATGEAPRCVEFRPDPNAEAAHVACGFDSGTVRVFVVEHTKLLHEYCQHQAGVYDVCFASDGKMLFSLALDDNICIYDADTQYQPMKLIPLRGPAVATAWALPSTASYSDTGLTLTVSADSNLVAAVSADGSEVAVINAPLCLRAATYSLDVGKVGKVVAAAFSVPPVGQPEVSPLLLAVTTTNLLVSIDLDGGGRATVLAENIHRNAVRAIAVSPDGSLIATGGQDRFVRLWQLQSNGELAKPLTYIAHAATVNKLQFDHRGVSLVSIGEDETVLLWELKQEVPEVADVAAAVAAATTELHTMSPQAATETRPSASVAAGFPPTPATARNKATTVHADESVAAAPASAGQVFSTVAMLQSATDSALVQLHPQKGLTLMDLQTKATKALPSNRNVELFVADSSGELLATAEPVAGPDDVAMIELWRCGTGAAAGPAIRMPSLRYHDQGVAAIEFLPDGLLVSAGVDTEGCVVVWEIATGVVLKAAATESSVRSRASDYLTA